MLNLFNPFGAIARLALVTIAVLSVTLGALLPKAAQAGASAWAENEYTRVRLISTLDGTGKSETATLGLQFELKGDWKVYWRSPGDAGYPPSIDWTDSKNFKAAEMAWPVPTRFSILGFESLGYKKEVVLPLTVSLERPGEALSIIAKVDYLACAELCIPYEETLTFDLPGGGAISPEAHLINRFQTRVPGAGEKAGLSIQSVEFAPDARDRDIGKLIVTASGAFFEPDLFVEGPNALVFDKPVAWIDRENQTVVLSIAVDGLKALKKSIGETPLRLTLVGSTGAAEFVATPTPATPMTLQLVTEPAPAPVAAPSLVLILALAVLGGLILNLMPCVLPVLSIKLLSVVGHGGGNKRDVRLSFIASSAGIISSFLVLAAILVALKVTGAAIGWGIQFQQPWFLIVMALIVTVFACNLWGFFEVHLPGAIAELGAHETQVHGLGKHFMTGAFATLLATPCSAPFLGTAVGFALARGWVDIFAVFAALGVGLALPYLVVAAWPGLATRMPRPGRWMVIMRRVLGFALAATALWLVSILGVQVSELTAWLVGAILLVVVVTFWLHHRLSRRFGRLDWAVVAVLATLALVVPGAPGNNGNNAGGRASGDLSRLDALWQPFDERAIPRLVAQGKTVFVDVTAEWCITCLVNKGAVLSQGEVYERLRGPNVVAMQADWTRPSAVISRYLEKFGRYGIPFNIVYGPGTPNGETLGELLSQDSVLTAMNSAAGAAPAVAEQK